MKLPDLPPKLVRVLKIAGALFVAWLLFAAGVDLKRYLEDSAIPEVKYSDFMIRVDSEAVSSVSFRSRDAYVVLKDGERMKVFVPPSADLVKTLLDKRIDLNYARFSEGLLIATGTAVYASLLIAIPVLLLLLMIISSGQFLGASRARRITAENAGVTFKDVAGIDEAKHDLQEMVDFLRNPDRFSAAGARIPKGVLLVGPPGNGKTLLARAVAGEADAPFYSVSASEFVELYVGLGAARIRSLFKNAREHDKCIVFIDEIDAVGGTRGGTHSHGEREQTLNQLLVEMDGIGRRENIIVIAATNRVDALDAALIRPGRFDRHIHVTPPDLQGRAAILGVHTRGLHLDTDVDLLTIARGTPGFSGADLANLCNEAALYAARAGRLGIAALDFDFAKDRILLGNERRTLRMSDEDRRLIAYHEAGHALVALHSPHADPIHKATIVPRGSALGMVVRLPEGDRVSLSRARLLADLAVAMGGRAAEELVFGSDHVTTGAEADLQAATDLAQRMVCLWGMSDVIGLISCRPGLASPSPAATAQASPFSPHLARGVSEQTAHTIDIEVRRLATEAMDHARSILTSNRPALDRLATALLDQETLSGQDIATIAHDRTYTPTS